MTVIETIKRRRSIGKMTEQRPTHEQIEQILEGCYPCSELPLGPTMEVFCASWHGTQ